MLYALIVAFAFPCMAVADDRPLSEQPYIGLSVRHYPDSNKCIVGWVYPGPLQGKGFTSPHVNRGDFVVAVGDVMVHTPDEFTAAIAKYNPGDEVSLQIHHTEGNINASVPTPGDGDVVEFVTVTLDSRAEWSGPVSFIKPKSQWVDADTLISGETAGRELQALVDRQLDESGLRDPIDKLRMYFSDTLDTNYGANMLSRVAFGFRQPTRLVDLQTTITDPLHSIPGDPALVLSEAAANIDAECNVKSEPPQFGLPRETLGQVAEMVEESSRHLNRALGRLGVQRLHELRSTYPELVQYVADNFYINEHPEVQRLIKALDASMDVDFGELLDAAGALSGLMTRSDIGEYNVARAPLPDELFGAVDGDVLGVLRSHDRWLVFGGPESNTYDMSRIDVVIDPGGDDTYRYPSNDRPRIQVIVDMKGNDQYIAADENVAGPASALLGVSLLVDYEGNDRYEGAARSCGVGVVGVGLLVDHGGADHYAGRQWSCGAAFYGLGAILDLGGNNDVYMTHSFSQAIGGPRGFGLILDESGRDLYRNNGPIPSVYGTDAVYAGISQGVGFGVRMYDSGGIGVLCDLAGDDRYEAGEFSQGGAYFWGLGVLYDHAGRDLYYGNRYTQGFAAHQALGILADDAGDDTYWGMTAATQSGSWDICSTLLIDWAGDDSYQADGLSQGGASMQAIAWLVDLAGQDRYNAPDSATQGQSGGNSYHYDATGCFSFSLLLDAGGAEDWYSTGRSNNGVVTTGEMNNARPENSNLHGLVIDLQNPLGFNP